jgi:ubiquinone biosynthesis accessory factor UbiJ
MITQLATRFLQHLTSQNQWSKPHLALFAGKTLCFDFVLAKANIIILEDGSLAIAGDNGGNTASPEANIHAPPSLLLRMMAGDEAAKMQFKIEGDTQLATEFSKVLQNMRWDYEEDLSKITGDIAANKIVNLAKKSVTTAKQQATDAAEMLSEYWQEEKPILAKKWQIEQFNADVDTLKSDVARLEKRLEKLQQKRSAKLTKKIES